MQHQRRIEHMARRRDQGLTYRELGNEYDLSPEHTSRLVRRQKELKYKNKGEKDAEQE
jgi:Mor family transcriptional regulator